MGRFCPALTLPSVAEYCPFCPRALGQDGTGSWPATAVAARTMPSNANALQRANNTFSSLYVCIMSTKESVMLWMGDMVCSAMVAHIDDIVGAGAWAAAMMPLAVAPLYQH